MLISSITAHVVCYIEPNDDNNERMTVLVEARDLEGTCGWGEAIAMWPEACSAVAKIVEGLAPLVVDEKVVDVDRHWHAMRAHSWWYGEGGIASMAIAAIDMALWDLKGKLLGKPLWQMLGKRFNQQLPVCASLHVNKASIDENVAQIASYITNDGFRSTKLGFGKRGKSKVGKDPDYDVDFVREVRNAIGADVPLYIDIGNGVRWSVTTALSTIKRMEEIGIDWIEEPLYPTDWVGYKKLKSELSVPIASGEREFTYAGYRNLLDTGAIDIFGVDPARVEGISGHLRIANMLADAGKTVNAHAWSTAISTSAALALSVCCPSAVVFELKPQPSPMQHELVDEPQWHVDGMIAPSDRAGLGIEPKRAVIEKYCVK